VICVVVWWYLGEKCRKPFRKPFRKRFLSAPKKLQNLPRTPCAVLLKRRVDRDFQKNLDIRSDSVLRQPIHAVSARFSFQEIIQQTLTPHIYLIHWYRQFHLFLQRLISAPTGTRITTTRVHQSMLLSVESLDTDGSSNSTTRSIGGVKNNIDDYDRSDNPMMVAVRPVDGEETVRRKVKSNSIVKG